MTKKGPSAKAPTDLNDPIRRENEALLGHAVRLQLRIARESREAMQNTEAATGEVTASPESSARSEDKIHRADISSSPSADTRPQKVNSKNKPKISRDMFPKAYHFEFFDTDDTTAAEAPNMEIEGYAVCGDWVSRRTKEKEFGVTIYFHKSRDADAAEKVLTDLGWDTWVEGL